MSKVCPCCGNDRFLARQKVIISVYVDGDNERREFLHYKGMEGAVWEEEEPEGPYICTTCRCELKSLDEAEEEAEPFAV